MIKLCPVERTQWGFTLQRPAVAPKGLLQPGQQAMEIQVQNVNVNHHEWAQFAGEDYTFYCKFCAELATQAEIHMMLTSTNGRLPSA